MRVLNRVQMVSVIAAGVLTAFTAGAQTPANLNALRGLTPVSVLTTTPAGQAALAANYTVTGGIQNGSLRQPLLLSFADQQQQSLRDAVITSGNGTGLADALGTSLAGLYQSKARQVDGKVFTSLSPGIAALFAYTNGITADDSNTAKFFFANATTDGKTPVTPSTAAIFTAAGGTPDFFGRTYHFPGGSAGGDAFGNSRPFQTEPSLTPIAGPDYFGVASNNKAYLFGPAQNLVNNPSYPSGHTTYGYAESVLLGLLVPERLPEQVTRAAEYGNDRIILGAHYTMDVLGGRTLALYDIAHLLANDPAYVGQTTRFGGTPIADYQAALQAARAEATTILQAGCGDTMAVCARMDTSRFSSPTANAAFYEATQTYGLPVVYQTTASTTEDVAKIAPEAGYLLTTPYPYLTLAQAQAILTATEGPGGGFLDDGSAFGLYSRLNLFAAATRAAAMAP